MAPNVNKTVSSLLTASNIAAFIKSPFPTLTYLEEKKDDDDFAIHDNYCNDDDDDETNTYWTWDMTTLNLQQQEQDNYWDWSCNPPARVISVHPMESQLHSSFVEPPVEVCSPCTWNSHEYWDWTAKKQERQMLDAPNSVDITSHNKYWDWPASNPEKMTI